VTARSSVAREHGFRLIDLPRACDRHLYDHTVEKVVRELSAEGFVDSIYQVGGVRHPGISDIDLLVVVDDDAASPDDPLESLRADERYLFPHSCFLVPTSLAPELGTFALLHEYRLLHGTAWTWAESSDEAEAASALRVQTALEFLAKNLLDLYVQVEYRVVKVRVLLQHIKGIQLDLTLLDLEDEHLNALTERAASLIDHWFERDDGEQRVAELAADLLPALRSAVGEATEKHELYSPSMPTVPFSPNSTLDKGTSIQLSRQGVRLPRVPALKDRQHFNAQHRVNRFRFRLPMTTAPAGSYHERRFDYLRRAKSFATDRFPAYAAPIPPLFYRAL